LIHHITDFRSKEVCFEGTAVDEIMRPVLFAQQMSILSFLRLADIEEKRKKVGKREHKVVRRHASGAADGLDARRPRWMELNHLIHEIRAL
jgi:hypothetical protein